MRTKSTLKDIFKILVHLQNYCKSYTSLKFWLKNILSLWSWDQFIETIILPYSLQKDEVELN